MYIPLPTKETWSPWHILISLLALAVGLVLTKLAWTFWQGVEHEIVASQPFKFTVKSELNTKVKHPEALLAVAPTVPNKGTLLSYVPKVGDVVLGPS